MDDQPKDARDRIEAMISPGSKWDLSPNDHAALESVLAALTIAEARAEKAEHALREAGRSLDSDARTIDDLRAQSESWRRGHGAWQTWAEEMLRARGMQPEGGLLGDGPARDALRARLERAEFTLTSRTFDEKEGLIETLRARLEAAERERDAAEMWSSKHGTEAQDLRARLEAAERESGARLERIAQVEQERDAAWADCHDGSCCACARCCDALEVRAEAAERERDEAREANVPVFEWCHLVMNTIDAEISRRAAAARYQHQASKAQIPLWEATSRTADAMNDLRETISELPGWTGHEQPGAAERATAAEARVRELEEALRRSRSDANRLARDLRRILDEDDETPTDTAFEYGRESLEAHDRALAGQPTPGSFNPDWDMLEATRDSLHEHRDMVRTRDALLAEARPYVEAALEFESTETAARDLLARIDAVLPKKGGG